LNAAFIFILAPFAGVTASLLFGVLLTVTNYSYNSGPQWRNGPMPLDMIGPMGYVLIIPFSSAINGMDFPSVGTLMFHVAMVLRSQLWGQIIDISYDMDHGRRTTAVTLGVKGARVFLFFLVLCELMAGVILVNDFWVSMFSLLSLFQALVEIFVYPSVPPTLLLAMLTGMVLTPAAGLLLLHVATNPVFM